MSAKGSLKHHEVIIIGTGFNGVAAAKTYLDIKPNVDVLLIDRESSLGGVWSASRIYPGLTYEMPAPLVNYSDMTMKDELGIEDWSDVTGYQVNEYLVRYARRFDIEERCKFDTHVVAVERAADGWKVLMRPTRDETASPESLTCDKLIIATGITSKPKLPDYDVSKFEGTYFHAVEMGRRHEEIVSDSVRNVTIVGGHKSALEAVGTASQAGKKVEWLMREEGGGPTWMMPAKSPDGSSLAKMSTKRFMAFASTSVYHSNRWLDRFLHSGCWWLGTWCATWFWGFMTKTVQGDKYTKSENGRKLKPHPESMFWFVPGGTITHDRDLKTLDIVDEGKLIHVNRAHITSIESRSVILSTGDTIPTDALVFCTGWELSFPSFFSHSQSEELGLPVDPNMLSIPEKQYWEDLDTAAKKEIDDLYPVLKNPPKNIHIPKSTATPFRLFRSMVPSKLACRGDDSILILGNYANGRVQPTAELASLWGVAYLEGLLPEKTKAVLADRKAMDKDIAHIDAYRKKRYLNCFPYRLSIFETPEYDDQMLTDLGLRTDRKRMRIPGGLKGWFGLRAWLAEWFESYLANDYRGIVQEFLESVERRKGKMSDDA